MKRVSGFAPEPNRTTSTSLVMVGVEQMHDAASETYCMARDCYDDCISFLDERLGGTAQVRSSSQGLLENTAGWSSPQTMENPWAIMEFTVTPTP